MNYRPPRTLIWLLVIAIFTTQCHIYHKHNVNIEDFNAHPNKRNRLHYHVIVHTDSSAIQLREIVMTQDGLKGIVAPVDVNVNYFYNHALKKRNFRAKGRANKKYIRQLHLFVKKAQINGEQLQISFSDLEKLEVIDTNIGLSTISTIGIGASSYFAANIILIVILCGCPHAYTYNGTDWEFTSTLFTGAVHPSLERYDYKQIKDNQSSLSRYSLQLRNELEEIQYTNELKLLAVYHPAGTTIIGDQKGEMYRISDQLAPKHAYNDKGESCLNTIASADNETYLFQTTDRSNFAHLYATFETRQWSPNSTLILRTKNSPWGAYVYNQFSALFGNKYDNWLRANFNKTQEQLAKNIDKTGILMDVEVKDGKQWKRIDQVQLVGDLAFHEVAVKIPEQYLQKPTLELRLKSGFHFWEIDELYMATASQDGFECVEYKANFQDNQEVFEKLANNDRAYFVHRQGDPDLALYFDGLRQENRTLFLKSKGYYRPTQHFDGPADYKTLLSIRKDGGMSKFSKDQFDVWMRLSTYFATLPKE